MSKELTAERANQMVLESFDKGIQQLETMDATESILFNPSSKLGLKVNEDGTVQACGIAYATRFTWADRQRGSLHPALRRQYADGMGHRFVLYGTRFARDICLEDLRTSRTHAGEEHHPARPGLTHTNPEGGWVHCGRRPRLASAHGALGRIQ